MHAHNSLIMSLYVYGVIPLIVVFFPIAILIFIRPTLIIVLSPLVIYSMGQFFLFWGASFSDIIFMSIVISASNIKHTKNESKAIKNESKEIKNESIAIKK
jgi:cellulose synthase/poly-beta-1,6-N-acetylglucosamine synthase-like glycosyltransferase